MPRNKLKKFTELNTFSNVAQENQHDCKQKLQSFLAKNKQAILELACGKGEYTLGLAKLFPDKKIIGIDIQGERLWHGSTKATEEKLENVFFLRAQIEHLSKYFESSSINEIWITFPDPFPKKSQISKRLTSDDFLTGFKKILKPQGLLHLKTDDEAYFIYSKENLIKNKFEILEKIEDIYQNRNLPILLQIQTYYEKKHLKNNKKIYYLLAKSPKSS